MPAPHPGLVMYTAPGTSGRYQHRLRKWTPQHPAQGELQQVSQPGPQLALAHSLQPTLPLRNARSPMHAALAAATAATPAPSTASAESPPQCWAQGPPSAPPAPPGSEAHVDEHGVVHHLVDSGDARQLLAQRRHVLGQGRRAHLRAAAARRGSGTPPRSIAAPAGPQPPQEARGKGGKAARRQGRRRRRCAPCPAWPPRRGTGPHLPPPLRRRAAGAPAPPPTAPA